MPAHKNFYETIQEAKMRLRDTVVRYKDNFYYVVGVSDHAQDGKFRIYMDELGHGGIGHGRHRGLPSPDDWGGSSLFKKYDDFIEKNPDSGFVRKYADSKYFEKFRPFPLGNVNIRGGVVYCERSPTRNMHQGLLQDAVMATTVESVPRRFDPYSSDGRKSLNYGGLGQNNQPLNNNRVDLTCREFYDMLTDNYPSFDEVITNLLDPEIMNKGCAFHREYSVMRGPLDMLFLCHRHCGVGIIDRNRNLVLGSTHEFLLEELTELDNFKTITIKEVKSDA